MSDFKVGDKVLSLTPVPYGNVKKILKMLSGVMKEMQSGGDSIQQVAGLMEKYLADFLPLLFRKGTVSFMTPEWIDDNVTVENIKEIVEDAIKVNGLEDFFGKATGLRTPVKVTSTEKPLSTTSSGSPTDGSPSK